MNTMTAKELQDAIDQAVESCIPPRLDPYTNNGDRRSDGERRTACQIRKVQDVLSETPAQSLNAVRAEAVESAIEACGYCGTDGEAWRSELGQYAHQIRNGGGYE